MSEPRFVDAGPCWVCGARDGSVFHRAVLDLTAYRDQDPELAAYSGTTVGLRRCSACGFGQPECLPALSQFFARMYDQQWSDDWVAHEFSATYKDAIFSRILRGLAARLPLGRRRLLDVGAHAGRFLRLAAAHGWTVEGIEINSRTGSYAARHTGLKVHCLDAQDVATLGSCFDAVTLTDVLEHIPDPVALLAKVRAVVAPGGWVAVKVPSAAGQRWKEQWRSALVDGYRPRLADNLVHVNHFTPSALRMALHRAGYTDVDILTAAPEYPSGNVCGNLLRLGCFNIARLLPFGTATPFSLNLQAYARHPA
jgi:SAM-dependent methyltransferase